FPSPTTTLPTNPNCFLPIGDHFGRKTIIGILSLMATMNRLLNNLSPWHLIRRLKQKDESYDIKYQMPGLSKDDVKISVEDGILFIRGEHKDSGEDENWWGASYSYYNTSLRLPEDAKVEEITAEMKNGVLHLIIPKDETKKKDIIKEVQVG
ncbi:Alpha crystallin/Hsp20 domain-containing protein, partial [Cynara cardunculus var. scolymus]